MRLLLILILLSGFSLAKAQSEGNQKIGFLTKAALMKPATAFTMTKSQQSATRFYGLRFEQEMKFHRRFSLSAAYDYRYLDGY